MGTTEWMLPFLIIYFFCLWFKSRSLIETEAPADCLEGNGVDTRESLEFNLALFLITCFQLHKDDVFSSRFSIGTSREFHLNILKNLGKFPNWILKLLTSISKSSKSSATNWTSSSSSSLASDWEFPESFFLLAFGAKERSHGPNWKTSSLEEKQPVFNWGHYLSSWPRIPHL